MQIEKMNTPTYRKKKATAAKGREKIKAGYLATLIVTSLVTQVLTQTAPPNLLAGQTLVDSFGVSNIIAVGNELDGDLQTEIQIDNSASLASFYY